MERKKKICASCKEEVYIYSRKMCLNCDRRENPHKHGFNSDKISAQNVNKQKTASKIVKNYNRKVETKYKEIYFEYFGYSRGDFVPCEVCGAEAVDIHHIDARGMGGDPTKSKDTIENLMALCRKDHETYGDIKVYKDLLRQIHKRKMEQL